MKRGINEILTKDGRYGKEEQMHLNEKPWIVNIIQVQAMRLLCPKRENKANYGASISNRGKEKMKAEAKMDQCN